MGEPVGGGAGDVGDEAAVKNDHRYIGTEVDTVVNWRSYKLGVTLPTGGPYQFALAVEAASGSDIVNPMVFNGEVEQQDIDSIYGTVVRPIVSSSTSTVFSSAFDLNLIAYRNTPVAASITDQTGAAIDLSGYNNWRFSVWDKTHSGSILFTSALDITGSNVGAISFTVPETAAFYSQIAAALTAGNDNTILYYDVIADYAADATKTRTLMRGQLILWRYEGAA